MRLFFGGVRIPNPASELPFKPPREGLEPKMAEKNNLHFQSNFFFPSELIPGVPGVPGVGFRGPGPKIEPPGPPELKTEPAEPEPDF